MTDELIELFAEGDIEKVLALTKESKDPEHMFFYLAGLRLIGEYEIALSYIAEHQMELYDFDAPRLIKWHVDILLELDDLNQALNVIKTYHTFPYFSLETNELISSLGDKIQQKRKNRDKKMKLDLFELERRLLADNPDLAYSALTYMNTNFHDAYYALYKRALLDAPLEDVKSFILFVLKEKKYNETLQVNKFGNLMKINPATAPDPFNTKAGSKLVEQIEDALLNDESGQVEEVADAIVPAHAFFIYPITYELQDVEALVETYCFIIYESMGRVKSVDEFVTLYGGNKETIEKMLNKYHFEYFK